MFSRFGNSLVRSLSSRRNLMKTSGIAEKAGYTMGPRICGKRIRWMLFGGVFLRCDLMRLRMGPQGSFSSFIRSGPGR